MYVLSNRKMMITSTTFILSIYMRQNTGLDLYHMRYQPQFHEKN